MPRGLRRTELEADLKPSLKQHVPLKPAEVFQQTAAAYDTPPHGAFYRRVADELIARIPPAFSPRSILEVGAGTGFTTSRLRERFPAAKITALEPSEAMLERGRRKMIDGVTWKCQKLSDESEGRFDLVVSSMSFHWLDAAEREKIVELASAGLLAMAVPITGGSRLSGNLACIELVRRLRTHDRGDERHWHRQIRHPSRLISLLENKFQRLTFERIGIIEEYKNAQELAQNLGTRGALYALFEEKSELAGCLLTSLMNEKTAFRWDVGLFVAG